MLSATALGCAFQGEWLSRAQVAGMAILAAGLLAIAYDGLGAPAGHLVWLGDLGFLAAGGLWGTFTFLLRRRLVDALQATAVVSVLSMAVVVPIHLALTGLPDVPDQALAAQAVYQGGLGGCLGVLAYSLAVGHLGARRAALFPSFVPALASLGLLTALDLFGHRAAQ
jgi:drug/metabolite transporter (DMT)-like permease